MVGHVNKIMGKRKDLTRVGSFRFLFDGMLEDKVFLLEYVLV